MDIKSLLPFKIHSENFSRREKYINTTKRNVEISIQSLSDKIYINLSEKKISSNIITLLFSRTHSNERWQNSLSPSLDLLPRFIPPLFLRSEVWLGNTETRMEIAFLARRFVPSYREGGGDRIYSQPRESIRIPRTYLSFCRAVPHPPTVPRPRNYDATLWIKRIKVVVEEVLYEEVVARRV